MLLFMLRYVRVVFMRGLLFYTNGGKCARLQEKTEDSLNQATERLSFGHAFLASISVIIVSEIGDKTFFIAAIMAMKHSR